MPDFNDVHTALGLDAVRVQINAAISPEDHSGRVLSDNDGQSDTYIPFGYKIKSGTLYRVDENNNYTPVCDPLYIEASARDDKGENWGRLLAWEDQDGKRHEWAMPSSMLAGDGSDYRKILLSKGLCIRAGRKAQNALHDYILSANPKARALSVSMPGWNSNCYIALDGSVYGDEQNRILLQTAGTLPKLDKAGTLQNWQDNVANYALGNSRLIFSIAAAFAGPLLLPANEGAGGFHFSGGSSTGKTTSLRVSASVWGLPLRSWRTTDNAAESWARFANDGFLAIDELGQVDGKAADQMAYMLGNGQTKGRSNRSGIAKDTSEFRLLFMSTGEIGLADKMGEGKKKTKAGQAVRMLEIPADAGAGYGLFENLHHFPSADEFAKHLANATQSNKGYAITHFLDHITQMGQAETERTVSELITSWLKDNVPNDADGQVKRAARRFALVAASGEIAIKAKILPWLSGSSNEAAIRCFQDWLNARGGTQSHEVQEGIKDILDFIDRFGNSRFVNTDYPEEKVIDRAGFRRKIPHGEWEYLFFPNTLRSDVLGGSKNTQDIIRAAISSGLITPDGHGKSSKSVNLPGLGKKRMICICPAGMKRDE